MVQSTDVDDEDWIPVTSEAGWLMLTRDSAIQRRTAEHRAVRDHNARMVALAGEEAKDTWAQLELLMINWRSIEKLLAEEPPFIYKATRTGLRAVNLE